MAALLGACGSLVDVRPLATGRLDTEAYELRGSELAPLRREAQRLCPQGGDILRQAARDQRMPPEDARLRRWLQTGTEWLSNPSRQAQLVVVCSQASGGRLAPSAPAVAGLVHGPGQVPAGVPTGPLSIDW